MPFFNNLPSFSSIPNPLNIFSLDSNPSSPVAGPSTPRSTTISPGTTPTGITPISKNNTIRPLRTSLKVDVPNQISQSSSSDSFDDAHQLKPINVRRKSSGNNVVIVDPLVGFEDGSSDRAKGGVNPRERPRSLASEMTGGSFENRKKKGQAVETFIIVKPPPTSGKNPLNLQIQLVMKPPGRGRERTASGVVSLRSVSSAGTRDTFSDSRHNTDDEESHPTSNIVDLSDSASAPSSSKAGTTYLSPQSTENIISTPTPNTVDLPGSELKRSSSVKSNRSNRSGTSASTASTSSAVGKRIVPLYNLAVHNVVQSTTVCDAGTDSKVAKFHKRTLDITGVGILEPSEIWLPISNANSANNLFPSPLHSEDGHGQQPRLGRPLSMISSYTAPLSPTATREDKSPAKPGVRASLDLKGFKLDNMFNNNNNKNAGEEGTTKRFFSKVFKRKGDDVPPKIADRKSPSLSSSSLENIPAPKSGFSDRGFGGHTKVLSNATVTAGDHAHLGMPTFGTAPVVQRRTTGNLVSTNGAVTGLSLTSPTAGPSSQGLGLGLGFPSSSPPKPDQNAGYFSIPLIPSSRPVGYTWTVRRWAKKNSEGWAAQMVAAAAAGLEMVNGAGNGEEDEVVFEWVKMRTPGLAGSGSGLTRFSTGTSASCGTDRNRSKSRGPSGLSQESSIDTSRNPDHTVSKTSLTLQIPSRSTSPSPHPSPSLDTRPWPVRRTSASASPSPRRSSSPAYSASEHSTSSHLKASSEIEPDTSSLNGTINGELTAEEDESDPEDSETPWICSVWIKKTGHRQLLGTLTPALHHPKVIGMLKIPRGLNSVALAEVKGDHKNVKGNGIGDQGLAAKIQREMALTEENLKDVVCVTAMWLVAREEFGGLGRKKKV